MSYEALLGRCSIRGRAADGRVSCVQICPPKISWLSSSSRVSSHFRLINQVPSRSPSLPCLLPLSLSLSLSVAAGKAKIVKKEGVSTMKRAEWEWEGTWGAKIATAAILVPDCKRELSRYSCKSAS